MIATGKIVVFHPPIKKRKGIGAYVFFESRPNRIGKSGILNGKKHCRR
jgi:hypothetical protein